MPSVLDEEKLALEEKEESKILSTKAVTAAEKQLMTFSIDKAKRSSTAIMEVVLAVVEVMEVVKEIQNSTPQPTSAPIAVSKRSKVHRPPVRAQLHVPWRGERGPGGAQLISCCC